MDLKHFVRDVPNFPREGVLFRDFTPLLYAPDAFEELIERMADGLEGEADAIAALDARGFVVGVGLAIKLKIPLVLMRKAGKLPGPVESVAYGLEYGNDVLEVYKYSFAPRARVLVADDLLATGGTVKAACTLIERLGAHVAGCVFAIELAALRGRNVLDDYYVRAVMTYE